MPYQSRAQQGFFHANRRMLEQQGVDVEEWDQASKGRKLPQRAPGSQGKRRRKPLRRKPRLLLEA